MVPPLSKKEQLKCRTMKELKSIAKDMKIRPKKLNKRQLVDRIDDGKPDGKITRKRKKKTKITDLDAKLPLTGERRKQAIKYGIKESRMA